MNKFALNLSDLDVLENDSIVILNRFKKQMSQLSNLIDSNYEILNTDEIDDLKQKLSILKNSTQVLESAMHKNIRNNREKFEVQAKEEDKKSKMKWYSTTMM